MKIATVPGFLGGMLCTALLFPATPTSGAQDAAAGGEADMQAMMAAMMKEKHHLVEPGVHHELLRRFLGTWDIATSLVTPQGPMAAGKGTTETSWLIDGRWIASRTEGTLMGAPAESFHVMGYDNFKMSYVDCSVKSMDTAMLTSEGDMDPGGDVLLMYGTLDEYLTGEHDKMVKYVYRFLSDDEILLEVHDLPIGEHNTKVMEVRMKRRS